MPTARRRASLSTEDPCPLASPTACSPGQRATEPAAKPRPSHHHGLLGAAQRDSGDTEMSGQMPDVLGGLSQHPPRPRAGGGGPEAPCASVYGFDLLSPGPGAPRCLPGPVCPHPLTRTWGWAVTSTSLRAQGSPPLPPPLHHQPVQPHRPLLVLGRSLRRPFSKAPGSGS